MIISFKKPDQSSGVCAWVGGEKQHSDMHREVKEETFSSESFSRKKAGNLGEFSNLHCPWCPKQHTLANDCPRRARPLDTDMFPGLIKWVPLLLSHDL